MELRVAIEKAKQILDEEQASPTVQYTTTSVPNGLSASESFLATTVRGSALIGLAASRLKRPRAVMQDPSIFSFVSVNHDLLRAIESQLSDTARPQFVQFVRQRLFWGNGCRKGNPHVHPSWDNLVSELPLVVEFLVRNGGKEGLASALGTKDIEIIPGHVMMLMQLEDTIALNYTAFSESEYEHLTSAIASFCSAVQSFMGKFRKPTAGRVVVAGKLHYRGLGDIHLERLRDAIFAVCRGITEQCRKAKYLYLKGSLLKGLNVEVNQDKTKVEAYLRQFGFTPLLANSLDEADRLYREQATPFDAKSSVGHLRSFLENLQKEAMPKIHAKYGGILPTDWGGGLAYLLRHGVLSKTEEQFSARFYALISDEGVHPLVTERDYARLARNMVIEYALLFLSKLDRLGIGN